MLKDIFGNNLDKIRLSFWSIEIVPRCLKVNLFNLSIFYLYKGRWKRGSFEKSILLSDKICLSKAICFRCIKVPSMQKGGHFSLKRFLRIPLLFLFSSKRKNIQISCQISCPLPSALQMFTGVYGVSAGFPCRLCMLWADPVIFTDCGENPMITIGFPRNL